MNQPTIFTFWEPRERMLPYLGLCMKTWERHLSADQVVIIDYSNIESFIGKGTYDLDLLKTLPLHVAKDAVMVAVLNRHGGIFMDADTILGGDISWVLKYLEGSEIVLFGTHLGFMAAQPKAKIFGIWEEGVRRRLEELKGPAPFKDQWDYVGNSLVTEAMIELTQEFPFCRTFDRIWQSRKSYHSASKGFWQKVANQRRWLIKLPAYRHYMRMLSPRKYGFIAEGRYFGRRYTTRERYHRFWFDTGLEVSEVFRGGCGIVGLHNTWTPEWYRELSEEEALNHDCLLSRTLRSLLDRN